LNEIREHLSNPPNPWPIFALACIFMVVDTLGSLVQNQVTSPARSTAHLASEFICCVPGTLSMETLGEGSS